MTILIEKILGNPQETLAKRDAGAEVLAMIISELHHRIDEEHLSTNPLLTGSEVGFKTFTHKLPPDLYVTANKIAKIFSCSLQQFISDDVRGLCFIGLVEDVEACVVSIKAVAGLAQGDTGLLSTVCASLDIARLNSGGSQLVARKQAKVKNHYTMLAKSGWNAWREDCRAFS